MSKARLCSEVARDETPQSATRVLEKGILDPEANQKKVVAVYTRGSKKSEKSKNLNEQEILVFLKPSKAKDAQGTPCKPIVTPMEPDKRAGRKSLNQWTWMDMDGRGWTWMMVCTGWTRGIWIDKSCAGICCFAHRAWIFLSGRDMST